MIQYQIKYVEAYIHFRKNKYVHVLYPVGLRQRDMLNTAYIHAKNHMDKIGKKLTVR